MVYLLYYVNKLQEKKKKKNEPADFTVQPPPPPELPTVGSFVSYRCLYRVFLKKMSSQESLCFTGLFWLRPKNVAFQQIHSNPN